MVGCDVNVSCTCTHGRASKATLQVNTGAIDGWWTRTRAKDSIPPSLHTLFGLAFATVPIIPLTQSDFVFLLAANKSDSVPPNMFCGSI